MDFEFESSKMKTDYISYYVSQFGVRNKVYQEIVDNYIKHPHQIMQYNVGPITAAEIICGFLKPEIAIYYGVKDKLLNTQALDELFSDMWLDDMVLVLKALEPLITDDRKEYLDFIFPYLKSAVDWYVSDIDAQDAAENVDISEIVQSHMDPYDEYHGCDIDGATDELEEIIKASTKDDLVALLSDLPIDLEKMIDVNDVDFCFSGAESVIESFFEPDSDCDEYEFHGNSDTGDYDEIQYIFER